MLIKLLISGEDKLVKSNLDQAWPGQISQMEEGKYQGSRGPCGAGVEGILVAPWS